VQGEIKAGNDKLYVFVPDLHQEFIARREERWPRAGEIVHTYIRFTFGGPTATSRF
jgi:hypothetical protein